MTPIEQYTVTRLQRNQIAQAFPLLQSQSGGLSLERWQDYAARLTATENAIAKCGIIVVESPRGYLRGLFSYFVGPHLSDGERVIIDSFIVVDTIDRPRVAMAPVCGPVPGSEVMSITVCGSIPILAARTSASAEA